MSDDITEFPSQRIRLQPCQICGRNFNVEILKKHQAICRKTTNKKRKVFDAGKQRAKNSDVSYKATKKTAQIYNGEIRVQDDRSKSKTKGNWREKHKQLIQSIREARSVTHAMKEGKPLPAFRPSEVPSDYVSCPYCHRNFNDQAAQRHIPFCQAQQQRKRVQPSNKSNQQSDRGRPVPSQQSFPHKQQSSNSAMYSTPHDVYNNGYKHSNSAPMLVRQNPSELPPPPPPRQTTGGVWGGFRKLFGLGPKEQQISSTNHYSPDDDDDYDQPIHPSVRQPIVMRTGRTNENTSLNVRARQRIDETSPHVRRAVAPASTANNQTRHQYGNGQYNSTRPTAVPRQASIGVRCGECGSLFNNASTRYCSQCGSRR